MSGTERIFYISGLEPAMGKQANDLLKAFDLGMEGVFVDFCHTLTTTLKDDVTQEQLDGQTAAIKAAYEQLGCFQVTVTAGGPMLPAADLALRQALRQAQDATQETPRGGLRVAERG